MSERFDRRRLLLTCGTAGTLAASAFYLLSQKPDELRFALPDQTAGGPTASHFPGKVKNVVFLLMAGAPSQVDLFDPKPALEKWAGKPFPAELVKDLKLAFTRPTATCLPSGRRFEPRGDCGIEISDWLPHLSGVADELCLVRSMQTDAFNHHPAQSLLMSGSMQPGRPSMGAWATYGLGCETQNLPAFVVMTSGFQGPEGGSSNWANGFLSSSYRGVALQSTGDSIPYLSSPPGVTPQMQAASVKTLGLLNAERFGSTGDTEIASRMESYELAFRMQMAAPDLMNISDEPDHVQKMYGIDQDSTRKYGTHCLLARRMIERGVRFVMLADASWDGHTFLDENHTQRCRETDQPAAALIRDLKQRGMLEETLIVWGGECGRTPMAEFSKPTVKDSVGRDHHADGFSMWLAGGGVRSGHVVGKTDELGLKVVEDPVHIHDLQATILHLLGLDHLRLTFRHSGRDFRLTDVGGNVVQQVLT